MQSIALGLLMVLAADSAPPTLPPCQRTPNCVSTHGKGTQAIAPFRYSGTGKVAMERLVAILEKMPRTTVISASPTSLTVEFKTAFFRFTDDAIFIIDDRTKTIQFRSASRVGRSDLGVNRRRMEKLRESFERSDRSEK
ncbi:MAG TPA: DUF1499 domain-containing protein [Thermoanaerobaculia bacterium]